jgi:hypothetical protein
MPRTGIACSLPIYAVRNTFSDNLLPILSGFILLLQPIIVQILAKNTEIKETIWLLFSFTRS